jgi:hypothetical protein
MTSRISSLRRSGPGGTTCPLVETLVLRSKTILPLPRLSLIRRGEMGIPQNSRWKTRLVERGFPPTDQRLPLLSPARNPES